MDGGGGGAAAVAAAVVFLVALVKHVNRPADRIYLPSTDDTDSDVLIFFPVCHTFMRC